MSTDLSTLLLQDRLFTTDRLSILHWNFIAQQSPYQEASMPSVLSIMTPNVTKALPDGWQQLDTHDKAKNWVTERLQDSHFYALTLTDTHEIIGYLFLYTESGSKALRLGYLLAESHWGKGLGSELVKGLVAWCKQTQLVTAISGGVEQDNIGSIKVLEKNGFYQSDEELPEGMLLYTIEF